MPSSSPALQQVSISLSAAHDAVAPASLASPERLEKDLQFIRSDIIRQNGGPVAFNMQQRHSPFNICVAPDFAQKVRHLHRLLDKALIDIIERWFTDTEADFPNRMPLEEHEEEVLRWIDGPGARTMAPFKERYGMWRTDYLIERDAADGSEHPKICEINARLPYNGYFMVGYHEEATKLLNGNQGKISFESPNRFDNTLEFLFSHFDKTKPVYHLRSKWPGVDSHPLSRVYQTRTGQPMIHITPSEVQLRPNPKSPTGFSLHYVPAPRQPPPETNGLVTNGEPKDNITTTTASDPAPEIQQCSLELLQEEYADIPAPVLQHLAGICVNDLRTVFLTHDKRILGIILQELPHLETRGVLTPVESATLRAGIADTVLSGTSRLHDLLQASRTDPTLKDRYIVKPIRDGSCHGISLGTRLSQQSWLDLLQRHDDCPRALAPHEDPYVIQRLVDHVWYDIVRHDIPEPVTMMTNGSEPEPEAKTQQQQQQQVGKNPKRRRRRNQVEKFHLIGCQHMMHSGLTVFGPWRIGEEVHVGLGDDSHRGLVMSCVLRPEGWDTLTEEEEEEEEGVEVK